MVMAAAANWTIAVTMPFLVLCCGNDCVSIPLVSLRPPTSNLKIKRRSTALVNIAVASTSHTHTYVNTYTLHKHWPKRKKSQGRQQGVQTEKERNGRKEIKRKKERRKERRSKKQVTRVQSTTRTNQKLERQTT